MAHVEDMNVDLSRGDNWYTWGYMGLFSCIQGLGPRG